MDLSLASMMVILKIGCPQYIYHRDADGPIDVYSRLGLGLIVSLESYDEAALFWASKRKDT